MNVQTTTSNLDFLWLELTNSCNLACIHCSTESDPTSGSRDKMQKEDYIRVMHEAYEVGCRKIQFIGGEPTLNKNLAELSELASKIGFEYVEIFSNLVKLDQHLIDVIKKYKIHVATSIYACDPIIHNTITNNSHSFSKTVGNIRFLVDKGISVRAGVIEMEENKNHVKSTIEFIESLGADAGYDHIRKVGRASETEEVNVSQLCGTCASGTLRIASSGDVTPCVMSAGWTIGSIVENKLSEILNGSAVKNARQKIYEEAVIPKEEQDGIVAVCTPKTCSPYDFCSPKNGPGPCAPSNCIPCFPNGVISE